MYSVADYGRMIADKVRMQAYAEALRRVVRPDALVVDLGAGTGIMSLLACRYGARRVVAIEPDDVIQVARQLAAANGFADRIEFIQACSADVSLPQKADVIVSDLRGALPFHEDHLPAVADVRRRLLAPEGILIPLRDTLWGAVLEDPGLYAKHVAPEPADGFGFNLDAARPFAWNSLRTASVTAAQLLTEPFCWATVDYQNVSSPNVSGELCWSVARAGTAHGFALWFDAVLVEGVGFSNAPGAAPAIYGQVFLPLPEPIPLAVETSVRLTVQANLVKRNYVWRWNTRVMDGASPGEIKAEFAQSTFHAVPLSPAQLRRQAADHVPVPNAEADADHFVLSQFRDGTPLGQIASRLVEQFPARFSSEVDALTHVAELSLKYSR